MYMRMENFFTATVSPLLFLLSIGSAMDEPKLPASLKGVMLKYFYGMHPGFGRSQRFALQVGKSSERLLCPPKKESCFVYNPDSDIGPRCWYAVDDSERENRCCSSRGEYQSPINIPNITNVEQTGEELRYDVNEMVGYLDNNGEYPKFNIMKGSKRPILYGVPTTSGKNYVFDSVHFHFGVVGGERQTEHLVQGKSYNAEAHIVHYREDYANLTEATDKVEGIVTIAIFFSVNEGQPNAAFKTILKELPKVEKFTEFTEENPCLAENMKILYENAFGCTRWRSYRCKRIDTIDLGVKIEHKCSIFNGGKSCGNHAPAVRVDPNQFLPNSRRYYNYNGSITTPPCSESVVWLVAQDVSKVEYADLRNFAYLESRIVNQLISDYGNLRPVQKLAGRTVKLLEFTKVPVNTRTNVISTQAAPTVEIPRDQWISQLLRAALGTRSVRRN